MTRPDEPPTTLDVAAALPPYAGSADPAAAAAAGDIVELMRDEHRKLDGLYGEVVGGLEQGDLEGVRRRLGGIVRETLEHEAAVRRVVDPAVEVPAEHREHREALMARLLDYDALNPDVDPGAVRQLAALVQEHLGREAETVVPRLGELPVEQRQRLGEDLRQVMG